MATRGRCPKDNRMGQDSGDRSRVQTDGKEKCVCVCGGEGHSGHSCRMNEVVREGVPRGDPGPRPQHPSGPVWD